MKTPILLCALLLSLMAGAQTQPASTQSLSATEREMFEERVSDIHKEIDKIDRAIMREERTMKSKDHTSKEADREISYIEKQEEENVQQTARLKAEIAGHDLEALEDKIKRVEKEQHQLERRNKRDANAIIKKKAQIEKLLGEIDMLEQRIIDGEQGIEHKEVEIEATQEEITAFALVTKNEQLEELEDDRASLKAQKNRHMRRRDKANDDIDESKRTVRALEVQRQNLMDELIQKETALRTGTANVY
ncbi:hypothetical protein [Sanyastnella coralliicola]|uniref:hypothetical protein n=1 Tax=Sanyastnella coralliicola TaxID=3069118 RepID=UPI0027B90060|nr:hypothetical protein [Longitalea sp. SCSIO 12813]